MRGLWDQIVNRSEDYQWSSAQGHGKVAADPVLSQECHIVKEIKDWSKYLRENQYPGSDPTLPKILRRVYITTVIDDW